MPPCRRLTTSYFARAAGLGGGEAAAAVPAAGRLEEPAVQQQVAAGGAVQQENGEQPLQQHAAAAAVKQEAVVKQEEGEQQQQQQQQQRQRRRLRQDEYGVVHVSRSLTDRERRRWLCRMPPPSHWQPSEGSLDMGLFHDKAAAQHAFRACMAWQELTGQSKPACCLPACPCLQARKHCRPAGMRCSAALRVARLSACPPSPRLPATPQSSFCRGGGHRAAGAAAGRWLCIPGTEERPSPVPSIVQGQRESCCQQRRGRLWKERRTKR